MCVLVSVRKRGKKKRRGGRGVCQIRVSGVTATRKSTCTYIYISVCVCVCVCVCACLCVPLPFLSFSVCVREHFIDVCTSCGCYFGRDSSV